MSLTYVIIEADEVSSVDFSEVLETSESTLRFNLEGDHTILKFEGPTPSFLEGKTTYNHSEILSIVQGPEWSDPNQPE